MTAQEAIRIYREKADEIAAIVPAEGDQSLEARKARNRIEQLRQGQDKLQAKLDRLGFGHLTGQRGRHHGADCTCRICFPTGGKAKFQIRLESELVEALKSVPKYRIVEALEALTKS